MFTRGLSQQTQKNLEILGNVSFVSLYYLAGGTSLSLHYGHRFSYDLDFFSQKPVKSIMISSQLKNKGKLEIFQNDEGTFNGQLNDVKLSFFIYPYKVLNKFESFKNIKVASIDDIACMKIEAISSRGTKRDFVDLFWICKNGRPLTKILNLFEKKYSGVKYNNVHLLKSFVYFDDAEKDTMPKMLQKISWEEVKKFFKKQTILLAKKYL
ncbi:nucleotidyl transferase AbiEii/AbiGii toxin family protein [Candidatus Roizmanbacteria bacterium]|nr:nucleotidyl transferase AbiEii/AbiGii toxin family protein [Candidatus Roizmanbacteria bacterium]